MEGAGRSQVERERERFPYQSAAVTGFIVQILVFITCQVLSGQCGPTLI